MFKVKSRNFKKVKDMSSLDDIHKKKMKYFSDQIKNLPKQKKKIETYKKQIDKLNKKIETDNYIFDQNDVAKRNSIRDNLEKIQNEVDNIESGNEKLEYLYLTKDILSDYYQSKNKLNHSVSSSNTINKSKKPKTKKNKKTNDIRSFLNYSKVKSSQKINYIHQYKLLVDPDYQPIESIKDSPVSGCSICSNEQTLLASEGMLLCNQCGNSEFIIVDSERPSYKEKVPDKPSHSYQRINHFKERISQFQGKESTDISKEDYQLIIKELNKLGYTNFEFLGKPSLKLNYIKKILKKLKLKKHYKHSTFIICKLAKVSPPNINQRTKQLLINMFKQIQDPFEKHKPKDRINFLSYSYVFFKFFELLGKDNLKKSFPLLKSVKKLREQDKIWKDICKELKWEYYPSPIFNKKR